MVPKRELTTRGLPVHACAREVGADRGAERGRRTQPHHRQGVETRSIQRSRPALLVLSLLRRCRWLVSNLINLSTAESHSTQLGSKGRRVPPMNIPRYPGSVVAAAAVA